MCLIYSILQEKSNNCKANNELFVVLLRNLMLPKSQLITFCKLYFAFSLRLRTYICQLALTSENVKWKKGKK